MRVVPTRFEIGAEGRDKLRAPACVIVKKSSKPVPHESLDSVGVPSLGQDLKYTEIVERDNCRLAVAV